MASFEEQLTALEAIVARLESGEFVAGGVGAVV